MRAYSPGGALNAFASVPELPPPPGAHRLLCGLPGYLNLFAPRTFAPQRQYMARCPPSPPVFFQISTDFTPTPGIPTSPPVLQPDSFQRLTGLSPALSHRTCLAACAPFTPNDSEQRSPPTYYRGCWHVVSRGLFLDSRHRQAIPCPAHSPSRKGLYNLTAFIAHAASLHQTFVHCGRFLAAASRRSLGRVSVPMWPNGPRTHPPARPWALSSGSPVASRSYPALSHVSMCYSRPGGRLSTCYSPVRRSRAPEGALPLDLHA